MGKIIKEIDLSSLPKKSGRIDWSNAIGYKVSFIYGGITGVVTIEKYNKANKMLSISYLNKKHYQITTGVFTKAGFGKLLGAFSYGFAINIGSHIINEKMNIDILNRKYNKDIRYYQYKCNNCGYIGWKTEYQLLNLSCCPACEKFPHVVAVGINDIPTTTPWMVKYFQGGYEEAKKYTKTSNTFFNPRCTNCGTIKTKKMRISALYNKMSIGCSKCSDGKSVPEKIMFSVLEQLSVGFLCEVSKNYFEWCERYRYDFFVPCKNIIIETHGKQHYEEQNNRNWKTLKEQQDNDYKKEALAKENGIKEYIIIDCRISDIEYIKKYILQSKLKEYFNLTNINWDKCVEFACNSMVKIVSEFKRKNPEMTTTQISEVFKIHPTTVSNY